MSDEQPSIRRFALLVQMADGSTATIYSEDLHADAQVVLDRDLEDMEDFGGRILRTMVSTDFTLRLGKFINAQLVTYAPDLKQSALTIDAIAAAKARTRS